MSGINKVILIGNLGKDPEVKYTAEGTAIAKFSLATTENYKKNSGEKVSKTTWHNIVFFGKLAEVCKKYLKKGDKVYVEGKIDIGKYIDRESGQEKTAIQIIGNGMNMLSNKIKEEVEKPPEDVKIEAFDDPVPF